MRLRWLQQAGACGLELIPPDTHRKVPHSEVLFTLENPRPGPYPRFPIAHGRPSERSNGAPKSACNGSRLPTGIRLFVGSTLPVMWHAAAWPVRTPTSTTYPQQQVAYSASGFSGLKGAPPNLSEQLAPTLYAILQLFLRAACPAQPNGSHSCAHPEPHREIGGRCTKAITP